MIQRLAPVLFLLCAFGLSACGNNDENNTNNENNTKKDMTQSQDMAKVDMTKMDMSADTSADMTKCPDGEVFNPITGVCVPDTTGDMDNGDMVEDQSGSDMGDDMAQVDMTQGGTATLVGTLTLTTMVSAGNMDRDGKGAVYVALFNENPLTPLFQPNPNAMLVGTAVIADVDLSTQDKSVMYKIEGITARAEPYYVSAFLDDNGNVNPNDLSTATPDTNDSIALDGIAIPTVELKTSGETTKDLVLNTRRPF